MNYYHIATDEWITTKEIQERLNNYFEFRCNDCGKEIGEHIKVLAEGIFCVNCFNKIMEDLK